MLREVSTPDVAPVVVAHQEGTRIGRYTLDSPIDDEGIGALYAARDTKLERRVALRLIPSTQDDGTPYSRSRLLRETRSMARLSHPNVIRIFDVGATRHALFIAMELLDGTTVADWIVETSPPWNEVLEAFVASGRGLAAAHEAGFVHGDFEPRHVMRTTDGRIVVVDFGLTRARTRADGLTNPGTDARLVRDDQYAFCSSLYEALFHEPPPPLTPEFEQRPAIRDSEVPRRVIRALARGLSRDHRFSSMTALLDALEHPHRRRARLAGAGAIVFAGGASLAYALTGLGNDEAACAALEPPGALGLPARETLKQSIEASPAPFAKDTAQGVDVALRSWVDTWTEARRAACTDVTDDPPPCLTRLATHASALVGQIAAGDPSVLEHATQAVLSLPPPSICDQTHRPELQAPLEDDLEVTWAKAWASMATGSHDAAIGVLQSVQHDVPHDTVAQLRVLALLGAAQAAAESPQAATRTLGQAVQNKAGAQVPWLRAYSAIALTRVQSVDLAQLSAAKQSLAIAREQVASLAEDDPLHAEIDVVEATLATQELRFEEARMLLERAEANLRARGERSRLAASGIAIERGRLDVLRGQNAAAMEHFRRAQRERTTAVGLAHPLVAEAMSEVASAWIEQGELVAARDTLETAASILETAYPKEHRRVVQLHGRLALLLGLTGRMEASFTLFDDVLERLTQAHGENSDPVAALLTNRAALFIETEQVAQARADLERALSIRRVLGDDRGQASVLGKLATAATRRGDPTLAEQLARQALALEERSLAPEHASLTPTLLILAKAIERQDRLDEARLVFERVHQITVNTHGLDHADLAFPLAGLGRIDLAQRKLKSANTRLTRAIELLNRGDVTANIEIEIRLDLARVHWANAQPQQAIRVATEARLAASKRHPNAVPTIDAWLSEHPGQTPKE